MGWTSSNGKVIQEVLNAELLRNPVGNPGKRDKPRYLDIVTAFDIEATRLPDIEQAFMYVWQWQIGNFLVMGRTWDEFISLCKELALFIDKGFGSRARMVVWVHNLSYEFSFLKGIYPFRQEDVFCVESRKVLKCTMFDRFEFRDSYIHSNMSLDQFAKKMGCKTLKLTGTFDYDKIRYPWTPLDPEELAYCKHDVIALVEAITNEMKVDGDDLRTIPLTSTGYVRREAREAMRSRPGFRSWLSEQLPDWDLYIALRDLFRGGNTHANRFYARKILGSFWDDESLQSWDFSSSYPNVLVNCEYPITKFEHRGPCTMQRLITQIEDHHYAMVIRLTMKNVRLRDPYNGCPYISKDKCTEIIGGVYDNGRVLQAAHLALCITDIDFKIIRQQYLCEDPEVVDSWESHYGYLPEEFRNLIREYYRKKTELKGDPEQAVYYDKVKAKANSLYGMTAQNPVKESIIYADWDKVQEWYKRNPAFSMPAPGSNFIPSEDLLPKEQLIKYNRKAFLCYQWGCWVTAHARAELQRAIDLCGDNFVYTDTDSVKFLGNVDFTEFNEQIRRRSEANGAYADDAKGRRHYMGVLEREKDYVRFRTWGAKKYAYEQWDEYPVGDVTLKLLRTHVTCAGVNKVKGGIELARHGGLEAFDIGMCFQDAGGTEAVYNDNVNFVIQREGHDLRITDNVVIRPSEYTLGATGDYQLLLHRAELMRQLHREQAMREKS